MTNPDREAADDIAMAIVRMRRLAHAEARYVAAPDERPYGTDRVVWHVNGDVYDNRPENLRVVVLRENTGEKR